MARCPTPGINIICILLAAAAAAAVEAKPSGLLLIEKADMDAVSRVCAGGSISSTKRVRKRARGNSKGIWISLLDSDRAAFELEVRVVLDSDRQTDRHTD